MFLGGNQRSKSLKSGPIDNDYWSEHSRKLGDCILQKKQKNKKKTFASFL